MTMFPSRVIFGRPIAAVRPYWLYCRIKSQTLRQRVARREGGFRERQCGHFWQGRFVA
jgi:hypothetical protein